MNIFMSSKITQMRSKLHVFLETFGKHPFSLLNATKREMYHSEKGQRKNLAQAIYYKDQPKGTLLNVSFWHGSRTNTQCQTGYLKVTWIIYIVR